MAIQPTEDANYSQQYTYDPTQQKVVPIEKARVVTYTTTNPNGLPSTSTPTDAASSPYNASSAAGDELLKKQAAASAATAANAAAVKAAAEKAAADKKAKLELDPDVIAARKLAAEAAAAVTAAGTAKTEAAAALVETKATNAANKLILTPTSAQVLTPVVTPVKPVGTPPAYVWDPTSKKWVMPPKPTDGKTYTWDNNSGWVASTIIAGSTGATGDNPEGPTLAINTFKNTLALFFGPAEINKPWVDVLYKSVSGFYKTGSTAEESFNMALQDVRNNPIMEPFTKRFKGIFALQDLKVKGTAVEVPTIAEYFKSEAAMGDVLRSSGLGSLANEDFLGDVLGKNVSVTEFTNRIVSIFDRIDQAPKEIKDTISRYFPTVDRVSLAKALALGDKGAKDLQKEVAGYEVLAAGEQQGLGANTLVGGLDVARAANYAAAGQTYQSALTNFGKVAKLKPGEEKLAAISGQQSIGQIGIEQAVINQNAAQQKVLEDLAAKEEARFGGKAGSIGSKAFASQNRGMLY
jgi:hypothetical protein